MYNELTPEKLANKFAFEIGGTYAIDEYGRLNTLTNGIVSADSRIVWNIPIDANAHNALLKAFDAMVSVALATEDITRTWGIWLDVENSCYLIESGRLFFDVDPAIDYAIEHNQRAIFDLSRNVTIDIVQSVIDSETGDSYTPLAIKI